MPQIASRLGLALLALAVFAGCPDTRAKDLVSRRKEVRMSANQLYNLGLAHLRAGDWAECERVFGLVLRRKRMVGAYANRGFCLRQQGTEAALEAALEDLERALEADPEATDARLGRALTLLRRGERARAEAVVAELAETAPEAAEALKAALEGSPEDPAAELGVFGSAPVPRRGPGGIMGD